MAPPDGDGEPRLDVALPVVLAGRAALAAPERDPDPPDAAAEVVCAPSAFAVPDAFDLRRRAAPDVLEVPADAPVAPSSPDRVDSGNRLP